MGLTVKVCRGLPASGKTIYAKKFISEQPKGTWIRVNKDDIRVMLCSEWSKGQEKLVKIAWECMIYESLMHGTSVIVDDTNLNPAYIAKVQEIVAHVNTSRKKKITVEVVKFDKSLEDCILHDFYREGNCVGEKVIRDMYNRWIKGTKNTDPVYRQQDESLPESIIVDLDGTVALMGDRSPYDASRCGEDNVNEPVREVIDMFRQANMHTAQVIFLSGRDSKYRQQTAEWIATNLNLEDYEFELYMRPEGSTIKDSIVKRCLYEDNVHGKYNVLFVLDDRDQVVKMWREELKLPCFQVNYGDF